MTENEAIKYMLSYKFGRGRKPRYSDEEIDEAFNVAITALKEIQQYREIGTVQECREAVEKRKPKKPKDSLKINPVIDGNVAYVDADMTVYRISSLSELR